MSEYQHRLLPFVHEPEVPCRPSIYGEGIFVGCWQRYLAKVPDMGSGECEEMFCSIFGDIEPVDQRDAMVAASFMSWLGTNAGASYLLDANLSENRSVGRTGSDRYLIAWARQNRRRSWVNRGRRTLEAIIRVPTIRDLEVIEIVAEWLGCPAGQRLIAAADAEIEETRKAIIDKNQMATRARVTAGKVT